MSKFNPSEFEQKWLKNWLENHIYKTPDLKSSGNKKKEKFYSLYSFPYPSGAGLHVGHAEGMVANDIAARYWRMKGKNVLFPMGWDSFGLPAENYAIKTGTPPEETTENAVKTFIDQINKLGMSVDWNTEVGAHRQDYYKWTQWIFTELFKKGLAYKKKAPVNWCPKDQTVLANEQVIDGKCERCDTEVTQRDMEQWFFKITDYADKLDKDLDKVDWPNGTKQQQRNWIGKSEGTVVRFKVTRLNSSNDIEVFTTRVDTIFGATFLVVAPEHEMLIKSKDEIRNWSEIEQYINDAKNKTDLERQSQKDKTGIKIEGLTAVNPFNNKELPIYVADYVLGGYGTGAIMAVPAHDERDGEFADKYGIEKINVIKSKEAEEVDHKIFTDYGILIKSGEYSGLTSEEATEKMQQWLEQSSLGYKKTNYRIRDWLVSRQRYWGCPIPILYKDLTEEEKRRNERYQNIPEAIFSFHAFGSDPSKSYHSYIDQALESQGIRSITPQMPNTNMPNRDEWHNTALEYLGGIDSDNIVITGRSLGCTSALKLSETRQIRKLILVAPTTPKNQQKDRKALEDGSLDITKEEHECLVNFVGLDQDVINYTKINQNVGETIVYLSTNDPYIPLEETKKYLSERINNIRFKIIKNAGHFGADHGYSEFRDLIDEVLKPVRLDIMPVPEKDLPLTLPTDVDFLPTGESPIARSESFKKLAEEKYGKGWRFEVDTMDTFVDSSWYFFRHPNAKDETQAFDSEVSNYWLPTDLYMIGAEHTVLHLLYSRFFTKFFYDQGWINFDEPFYFMRHMGTILGPDGRKMSKRWGNVINPTDEIAKYGADTLRMYEMFMGPLDESKPWNDRAENGVFRFLSKVWDLQSKVDDTKSERQIVEVNKLIKKVSEDTEKLSFNTAVSEFMKFTNFLTEEENINIQIWKKFLLSMAPYAPFITEELWSKLGMQNSIHLEEFPEFNLSALKNEQIKIAVQINGKVRGTINISNDEKEESVIEKAKSEESIAKYITTEPKKIIYVQGRILNIIV